MVPWMAAALALSASVVKAATVTVAVAANFAGTARELATPFEQRTGHRVVLSVGSTGALAAQVRQGAPFDVLMAADADTPAALEKEGLAVPGSRFTYAEGALALWSAQAELVDAQAAVLQRPAGQRLALANPKLAPYGRAAQQTLERLGHAAAWQGRLVEGNNIAQVWQWVASGHAPMGFVAWSQVSTEGRLNSGSVWRVPAHLHDPILQDAVLLKAAPQAAAAADWLQHLRRPESQALIRRHGYRTP